MNRKFMWQDMFLYTPEEEDDAYLLYIEKVFWGLRSQSFKHNYENNDVVEEILPYKFDN